MSIQKDLITVEKFVRRGQTHWMLFTNDEESAMLLKSAFLPGQQKEVQMREQQAFAKGFWSAIQFRELQEDRLSRDMADHGLISES